MQNKLELHKIINYFNEFIIIVIISRLSQKYAHSKDNRK